MVTIDIIPERDDTSRDILALSFDEALLKIDDLQNHHPEQPIDICAYNVFEEPIWSIEGVVPFDAHVSLVGWAREETERGGLARD